MKIEYLSQLKVQFSVEAPNGGDHWTLTHDFPFLVDDHEFLIPAGFWTNFASVPRSFWSIISPYDLGVGCIPHDFGYYTHSANKDYWDLVFLACMEKDGIKLWKRQAAYYAVKYFGQSAWDNNTRRDSIKIKSFDQMPMSTAALNWKTSVASLTYQGKK